MTPFQETCWAGMDSMIPLHFILTGLLTCRLEAVHVWEQLNVLLGMVLVGAKEQIKQMNVQKRWISYTSSSTSLISLKNHVFFFFLFKNITWTLYKKYCSDYWTSVWNKGIENPLWLSVLMAQVKSLVLHGTLSTRQWCTK